MNDTVTPIVFVFGELLPKYFFYHTPYRLLTAARPPLLLTTVLLSPVSLILGLLAELAEITGQTPFRLRSVMARGGWAGAETWLRGGNPCCRSAVVSARLYGWAVSRRFHLGCQRTD